VCDFEHGEEMPRVALALVDEMLERVVVDCRGFGCEPALLIDERPLRECGERVFVERFETKQRAAREQRTGEREERVLRRRADEHEEAFLDERQQHVLLGAAEAMHLVEEEDRSLAVFAETVARPVGDLAHVFDPGAHRAQGLERF
jgi:hypothetical protein